MLQGKDSAIQRIQVGLLGIVAVLLFVSLANVLLEQAANRDLVDGGVSGASSNGRETPTKIADEPLAELGAAPVVENDAAAEQKPAGKAGAAGKPQPGNRRPSAPR